MRWSKLILCGALLVTGVVGPLQAQEPDEECVCPRSYSLRVLPREGFTGVMAFDRQARLGVWVHQEANPETDRYGALIDRVQDGSPADKAGIEAGDIIIELNGEDLLSGGEDYDEELSAPGQRLIEVSHELDIGDTVSVKYRRDGDEHTVDLVAGEFGGRLGVVIADAFDRSARLRSTFERLERLPEIHIQGPENFAFRLGASLPG